MPESEPELQSEEFRKKGAPEYLIINDLGDRVTFQRFTGREPLSGLDPQGQQIEMSRFVN